MKTIAIPTHWNAEQALEVFELIDDLREAILSQYQIEIQQQLHDDREIVPVEFDDEIPF